MKKIRVGVQLQPQHTPWADFRKATIDVDRAGFDSLWTWDHFYPLFGQPGDPVHPPGAPAFDLPNLGDHFECYSLLSAMAILTERVEFGALVTCNNYRNPQLLADMARTIDHMSGGRFILGIGSGWFERDYQEYGYEFGTAGERLKKLDANLPIIRERLAKLTPPPVRTPLPVMIGGGGEKVTLRIVAEQAQLWNCYGTPEDLSRKNDVLDDWCRKIGRDPNEIERTMIFDKTLVEDDFEGKIQAYMKAGMTHFIFSVGIPFDMTPALQLLKWRNRQS